MSVKKVKYRWKKMYTFVLLSNAFYIFLFWLFMRYF